MQSRLVQNNYPTSSEHHDSDSDGYINNIHPAPGSKFQAVHRDRNGKTRTESENSSLPNSTDSSRIWESDNESSIINVDDLGFSAAPPSTQAVDESPIGDVMDAKKLRMNLGLARKDDASVKISIKEKIKSRLVKNQLQSGVKDTRFLPIDKLHIILSDNSIKALLQEEDPLKTSTDICNELHIYRSRRRILGILLYMHPEHLRLFEDFVNEDITDNDLPLTPTDGPYKPRFQTRYRKENTTMLMNWEENDIMLFHSYQPIFLAPFFDIQDKRLCNYLLDETIRLPWLNYKFKTRGGNGMVHQVEIHPSHHNFKSHQPSGIPLYFALKEISGIDEQIYKQELLALERPLVEMQKEKHLIRLLLTFQHGHKYYFLFEWADGNLWDYWHKYPKGSEDAIVNSTWLAEQCLGLATAVKRIHGLATWQKERRKKSEIMNQNEREWGRHGDIKPHNILWFSSHRTDGCFLVLSDLGLTRYHSSVTRSLVSPTSLDGCTDLYRPPEMDMPGQHICSRYDIWSLGCVFLEFCTWWLKGSLSVTVFENKRVLDDHDKIFDDPTYFFVPTTNTATPQVKPSVKKWIDDLRKGAKGDLFAEPMLNLIQDKMLVINKQDRAQADFVCAEIRNIVTRLRNANNESTSSPEILINHERLGGRSCEELHQTRTNGSGRLTHLRKHKECETQARRLSEENLVPHTEGCWDSRSSNDELGSAMENSSNYNSDDEALCGLITPESTFDDIPTSKHETRTEIEEWCLNAP